MPRRTVAEIANSEGERLSTIQGIAESELHGPTPPYGRVGVQTSGTYRLGREELASATEATSPEYPEAPGPEDAEATRPEDHALSWSECAESYDVFAEAVTGPFATDALRLVNLEPGMRVLDVAAGTGAFALRAAARDASVMASDFSPGMLRRLELNAQQRGISGITTAQMDGQALTLEDDSFDVAASLFGLMFFPEPERGLTELHRVLRPGGRALISCWAPPAKVEFMRMVGEAALYAMVDVPWSDGPPRWTGMSTPEGMVRQLKTAGFAHAHVVTLTHMWTVSCAERLARLLPTMTPSTADIFARMTQRQQELFTEALVGSFRLRQAAGPYAITSEALIGVATKA